jgi:site-specific recombinase XerD
VECDHPTQSAGRLNHRCCLKAGTSSTWGSCARYAGEVLARCRAALDALGILTLADLDPTPAERWLADRRSKPRAEWGIGRQTSNHIVACLKALGNFLVKTDRAAANPFQHRVKLNVEAGVRHARRALAADEFDRLLAAARAGGDFRGPRGDDRAVLYWPPA